jgi:hypothetical protein
MPVTEIIVSHFRGAVQCTELVRHSGAESRDSGFASSRRPGMTEVNTPAPIHLPQSPAAAPTNGVGVTMAAHRTPRSNHPQLHTHRFARRAPSATPCQPRPSKIFLFTEIRIWRISRPSRLATTEGRFADVTRREAGMRWTRMCLWRSARRRTAKWCGPGAPRLARKFAMMLTHHAGEGGNRQGSPGRAPISRKTIAQGRPV